MLAAANVFVQLAEMASFILNDGLNEMATERHRRRIASHYFQAQRRSQPTASESA